MTTIFSPPLSGVVLKHVIDAFDLRRWDTTSALSDRSASRFFAGERLEPKTERRIWKAAADAIISAGLLGETPSLVSTVPVAAEALGQIPPEQLVSGALSAFAAHWDNLAGALRRLTPPIAFPRLAHGACVRLLVIDLSIRLAGVLWLTRSQREEPLPRHWSEPRGVSNWLRGLLANCSPPITRDELSMLLKVNTNTVDAWLDSEARPSDENLEDIAEAISKRSSGSMVTLLRELRLNFGLRTLFRTIEATICEAQALDAAERFVTYPLMMLRLPRASEKELAENDQKLLVAMLMGSLGREQHALLPIRAMVNSVWREEPDPVWRTALQLATRSWFRHLQWVAAKLGPTTEDEWNAAGLPMPNSAKLEQIAYRGLSLKHELARDPNWRRALELMVAEGGKTGALELKLQAVDLEHVDDLAGAITRYRQAVHMDPCDAEIHFRLGGCLWQVGDLVSALEELEIATQLAPEWDRPWVEIGIMLLNRRRDREALERLRVARSCLSEPSPWLLLHLGLANERVGNLDEAIEAYREASNLGPHGEALDRLAHLLFRKGEKREGAEAAKQAAHLGFADVFNAWKAGDYRGRPPTERPRRTAPEHLRQLEQYAQ